MIKFFLIYLAFFTIFVVIPSLLSEWMSDPEDKRYPRDHDLY